MTYRQYAVASGLCDKLGSSIKTTHLHLGLLQRFHREILYLFPTFVKSGGSVVDNALDYQYRGRNPRFTGLSDETFNRGPVSA